MIIIICPEPRAPLSTCIVACIKIQMGLLPTSINQLIRGRKNAAKKNTTRRRYACAAAENLSASRNPDRSLVQGMKSNHSTKRSQNSIVLYRFLLRSRFHSRPLCETASIVHVNLIDRSVCENADLLGRGTFIHRSQIGREKERSRAPNLFYALCTSTCFYVLLHSSPRD